MSDSARNRPGSTPAGSKPVSVGQQKVFRSLKPGELGAARMNPVNEERSAANDQIQRSLKAWRAASGSATGRQGVPKGGGGSALPTSVRTRMEPKLGADLSGVRVHTGGESADAAKGFGARAFTVGDDVHFNAGEFQPGTKEGDKLLAHELTHVVQGQKSGIQRKPEADDKGGGAGGGGEGKEEKGGGGEGGAEAKGGDDKGGGEVSDPNEPAEKEADAVGDKVGEELHGDEKGEKGDKKDAKGGDKKKDKDKKDKDKDKKKKEGKGGEKEGEGGGKEDDAAAKAAGEDKGEEGNAAKKEGGDEKGAKGEGGEEGAEAKGEGGEKKDAKGGGEKGGEKGGGEKGGEKGGDAKGGEGGGDAKGGEGGGDAKGGEQKAPAIAAKLYGTAFKIYRAGPTPAPASKPATPVTDAAIPVGPSDKALATHTSYHDTAWQSYAGDETAPNAAMAAGGKPALTESDFTAAYAAKQYFDATSKTFKSVLTEYQADATKNNKPQSAADATAFATKVYTAAATGAAVPLTNTAHWTTIIAACPIAARKMEELAADPCDGALKTGFTTDCKTEAFGAREKAPWGIMKDHAKGLVLKGTQMTAEDFHFADGETLGRTFELPGVYAYSMDPAQKQKVIDEFKTKKAAGQTAAADDKAYFLEKVKKEPAWLTKDKLKGPLSGGNGVGWWFSTESAGINPASGKAAFKKNLALRADWGAAGAVYVELGPADVENAVKAQNLHKPTPFDGMGFKEWKTAPDEKWGLTDGDPKPVREVVIGAVDLGSVLKFQVML